MGPYPGRWTSQPCAAGTRGHAARATPEGAVYVELPGTARTRHPLREKSRLRLKSSELALASAGLAQTGACPLSAGRRPL